MIRSSSGYKYLGEREGLAPRSFTIHTREGTLT